uniref:Uncharacterized protein n=1 Tax=Rhizophora mucronata TaxID=61149 RepID=A0A2P2Q721_RHIMU
MDGHFILRWVDYCHYRFRSTFFGRVELSFG